MKTITPSATKAQLLAHIAVQDTALITAGREAEAMRLRLSIAERNIVKPARTGLPAHFIAARLAAMAMGRAVKVVTS